jgi:hypothetical protein
VGLYRRLWESCVSNRVDRQHIEAANEKLRTGNIQLCNEGNHLKHRQDEQVARLPAIDGPQNCNQKKNGCHSNRAIQSATQL